VAVHHATGDNTFDFPTDPNINQFAQQPSGTTPEILHSQVLTAFTGAAGKWNINMAENKNGTDDHETDLMSGDRTTARRRNWASGLAGAHFMVLGAWESANATPTSAMLSDWGRQVAFFEATNFNEMIPNDALAAGSSSQWVMAKTGNSYIIYTQNYTGSVGLSSMTAGIYDFTWLDSVNGTKVIQNNISVGNGIQTWSKPGSIGNELAVYIKRVDGGPAPSNFPTPTPTSTPRPTVSPSIFPSPSPNPADADGDGDADIDDFKIWIGNYAKLLSGKSNGDFSLNGKVNLLDYGVWLKLL
jgi:hypothetical protein